MDENSPIKMNVSGYTGLRVHSYESLSAPYLQHHQQRPTRNTCHQCGKSYKHNTNLKRHIKFECGQPPRFICFYCPQRCKHKNDMKNHILRCHKGLDVNFYTLWYRNAVHRDRVDWSTCDTKNALFTMIVFVIKRKTKL